MSKAKVKEKIQKIEAELELLKRTVQNGPNFSIDTKNWNKIATPLKNTCRKIYKKSWQ